MECRPLLSHCYRCLQHSKRDKDGQGKRQRLFRQLGLASSSQASAGSLFHHLGNPATWNTSTFQETQTILGTSWDGVLWGPWTFWIDPRDPKSRSPYSSRMCHKLPMDGTISTKSTSCLLPMYAHVSLPPRSSCKLN